MLSDIESFFCFVEYASQFGATYVLSGDVVPFLNDSGDVVANVSYVNTCRDDASGETMPNYTQKQTSQRMRYNHTDTSRCSIMPIMREGCHNKLE